MRTEYTNVATPGFVVDPNSVTQDGGHQIDWTYVLREDAVLVTAAGTNAQGATALGVAALPGPIPSGTLLQFGADEYATTTAAAAAGATSIAVSALVNAIEAADTATYAGVGDKTVPAGKVMSILSSGKMVPRAQQPGSEGADGLLATAASENSKSDALTGYGLIVGGVIFENLLPDAAGGTTISSTYKTELQTAGIGTGFSWKQYSDSRSS